MKQLLKGSSGLLLFAVTGALLSVMLFGKMSFHMQALQFEASLRLSGQGITVISVPPAGTISANTHRTPLKLSLTLQHADADLFKIMTTDPVKSGDMLVKATQQVKRSATIYTLRLLFLAVTGGLFGVFLLKRRRITEYVTGALAGLFVVAVLIAATYGTYQPKAFLNPRFQGALEVAPLAIGVAEETILKLDRLGDRMRLVAGELYRLFEKADTLNPLGRAEGDVKVLHVSDIHNNPAAFDMIKKIVSLFNIDL